MVSPGMLRRVALVRTDVSEEHSASFIRVTGIGELEITLAATSNRRTLQRNVIGIPEDTILQVIIIYLTPSNRVLRSSVLGSQFAGVFLVQE
jgi:hypothetical protein